MWPVFSSTGQYRRDNGKQVGNNSSLKPYNAEAVGQMYGYGIVFVTVDDFFKWAFKVLKTYLDRMGKERRACTLPGPF